MKRLALSLLLVLGCRSKRSDPEDLKRVFDRVASASPATSASAAPSASTGAGRRAAPAPTASASAAPGEPGISRNRRTPVKGPCLATSGEPARSDDRRARRPACRRAEVLERRDPDGAPRYACLFPPLAVEKRAPLPVLVYFHGEDESPARLSKETDLRTLGDDFELSGSAAHPGFLVLAPQARRIRSRVAFDVGHVSEDNADVRTTDLFLEELTKRGWVDPRRVYAIGDGVGGEMAALWSMLRPDRVAAYVSVSGNASALRWSCNEETTPAMIVYRSCDTVAPCLDMEQWLGAREQAHAPTLALRLGTTNRPEPSCQFAAQRCPSEKGATNHRRWPKGKEREMLGFLGRYSLDLPEP